MLALVASITNRYCSFNALGLVDTVLCCVQLLPGGSLDR